MARRGPETRMVGQSIARSRRHVSNDPLWRKRLQLTRIAWMALNRVLIHEGCRSSRWVASAGRMGHGVQVEGQLRLKGPLDAAGTTQPMALALEGEIAMWDAPTVERLGHKPGLGRRHDGVLQ